MSQPPTPGSGQRPEKTMSSRLLTMRFMQRAAASSPSTSTTKDSSTPPPKRQKTTYSTLPTPATPFSNQAAIQAALEAEEAQREAAIERVAAERGETKWVLSFVDRQKEGGELRGMKVVKAGYSEIDNGEGKVGGKENRFLKDAGTGRRSFGRFNRELEKQQQQMSDMPSSSSDEATPADKEEHDYNSDDEFGTSDLIRESKQEASERAKSARKAKRKAAKAEATQLAEKRKSKEVKLNKLTSISGGTAGGKGRNSDANIECHGCGQKGHRKADCPNQSFKRKTAFDGQRPLKKLKKSEVLDY